MRRPQQSIDTKQITLMFWKGTYSITSGRKGSASPGHIALKTYMGGLNGSGYYISFWPGRCREWHSTRPYLCQESKDHFHTRDMDDLVELKPPEEIHLYNLNVETINEEFRNFCESKFKWGILGSSFINWNKASMNCAGLVFYLLKRAGILNSIPTYTFFNREIMRLEIKSENKDNNKTSITSGAIVLVLTVLAGVINRTYMLVPIVSAFGILIVRKISTDTHSARALPLTRGHSIGVFCQTLASGAALIGGILLMGYCLEAGSVAKGYYNYLKWFALYLFVILMYYISFLFVGPMLGAIIGRYFGSTMEGTNLIITPIGIRHLAECVKNCELRRSEIQRVAHVLLQHISLLSLIKFEVDDKQDYYGLEKAQELRYKIENCLFAAIAKYVDGKNATEMRQLAVNGIMECAELQEAIMSEINSGETTFELMTNNGDIKKPKNVWEYTFIMRNEDACGTGIEIATLSRKLGRPIVIITPKNKWDLIFNQDYEGIPIFLAYERSNHYVPLCVPEGANAREILQRIQENAKSVVGLKQSQEVIAASSPAAAFHKGI